MKRNSHEKLIASLRKCGIKVGLSKSRSQLSIYRQKLEKEHASFSGTTLVDEV
jgi:hypothetical protein